MITFTQASTSDIFRLMDLHQNAWPCDTLDPSRVEQVLAAPDHPVTIAIHKNQIIGYLSCFPTLNAQGCIRNEFDSVAVHVNYRGRGIAAAMIRCALDQHPNRSGSISRALIETHNTPSQSAFAKSGFTANKCIYGLYVCRQPRLYSDEMPPGLHLIPVQTLTYRGAWIEGKLTQKGLRAALQHHFIKRYDLTGVLISKTNRIISKTASEMNFQLKGYFQWWTTRSSRILQVPDCLLQQ